MITVSAREFRENQKNYLDKVAEGLELLITRRNESFKIVKVSEDDTLMSKEQFYARIDEAISDVMAGKSYAMEPDETLDSFVNRMKAEGHVSDRVLANSPE